jgi:PAS domain S-box-containing protein
MATDRLGEGGDPGIVAPADDAPGERAARRALRELARDRDMRFGVGQAVLVGLFVAWAGIALNVLIAELFDWDAGYILLMASAVVAAWFGGLVGGLTAVLGAALLAVLVAIAGPDAEQAVIDTRGLVLFLVAATATVVIVARRRASNDRLVDALDEVAALAAQVEARDARLGFTLSASGTGFWEWDIISGDLSWSDEIFRQHGLEPSDEAPRFGTYLDAIHPDDRPVFEAAIADAIAGTDTFGLDFRVVWPDGTVRWTHGAGRIFRDGHGRAIRMIGTGQDITERRELEAQRDQLLVEERRAGEFREAFIDVISHELRTPITTILGLTEILARPGRSDTSLDRDGLLDDVRAESERLHRLVEDLLVLSRVERGRLAVETEPIELRRLFQRVVEHEAVELPSISIRATTPDWLPIVAGDPTYVEQILRNLLGNAAKYTPPGTVVAVSAEPDGDAVVVRVADEGPGIQPESRDHLFDLFYRDPTSARAVAGSGIGLFVCASLVEAMGGRIWVEDAPGGGALFAFTLRTLDPDREDPTSDHAVSTSATTG